MPTNQKIDKAPFDFLDTYQEEAFVWTKSIWAKIYAQLSSENLDIEMVSIALANIHSDFIHTTLDIYKDDFEYYLSELYGEEKTEEKWELMHTYCKKICKAISLKYGSESIILESLEDTILTKRDEEEDTYIRPMGYSKGDAITFVGENFSSHIHEAAKRKARKEFNDRMGKAFVDGLNRQVLKDAEINELAQQPNSIHNPIFKRDNPSPGNGSN